MRAWRRASRVCLDGDLPGRTYAPAQRAARAGCRGAPLAEQLSGPEGGDRERFASSIMSCCVRNGPHRRGGGSSMIEMRRAQLSFGDGLIAEEVSDLREDWMKHADAVLADRGHRRGRVRGSGKTTSQEPQPRPARCPSRGGAAAADPQAHPQLELRSARARGARQSGVPRLHSRRRRQDAGCQDDGTLGRGGGARSGQADSPKAW